MNKRVLFPVLKNGFRRAWLLADHLLSGGGCLHVKNGWLDLFLTLPITAKFSKALPQLLLQVVLVGAGVCVIRCYTVERLERELEKF